MSDINFTKLVDSTTVGLLTKVTTGAHIPTAVVTTQLEGTATMEYTLDDVNVTAVQVSGSGGQKSTPSESVSLTFEKITWTHTDGAGIETTGSFDVTAGTP